MVRATRSWRRSLEGKMEKRRKRGAIPSVPNFICNFSPPKIIKSKKEENDMKKKKEKRITDQEKKRGTN